MFKTPRYFVARGGCAPSFACMNAREFRWERLNGLVLIFFVFAVSGRTLAGRRLATFYFFRMRRQVRTNNACPDLYLI